MLSLLLTLSLGQTSIWPPITSPPFLFDAPLEPIRVEGVPAIEVTGSQIMSVWLDRRRGLDQLDAGLDVWAGSLGSGAEAFSAVLLTPVPRPCGSVRLGTVFNGMVATWACFEPDAGIVEQARLTTGTTHLPALTRTIEANPGPALDLRMITAPRVITTTRRATSITILPSATQGDTVVRFGTFMSQSLVFTLDGGAALLTTDSMGAVGSFDLLPDGGAVGPAPVGMNARRVIGIQGKAADTFFYENATGQVLRKLPTMDVLTSRANLSSAEPVVAALPDAAVALYATDAGLTASVVTDVGSTSGSNFSSGGTPLAIGGSYPDLVIAERTGGEVKVRPLSVTSSLVTNFGLDRPAFQAPRPQVGLTAAFSENDNGFLVMWDQRDGGAWQTRSGVVDNGGVTDLDDFVQSAQPGRPSLTAAPDGGLYVALTKDTGRALYEVIGGVLASRVATSVLPEVVVGNTSHVTWDPTGGLLLHSNGMPLMTAPIPPGCVAWWQGLFAVAKNGFVIAVDESGLILNTNQALPPLPMPLTPVTRQCLVVNESGTRFVTTSHADSVSVHEVAPQRSLGTQSIPLAAPPASVAVGDGVVVVSGLVSDGGTATLRWMHFTRSFVSSGDLSTDTQPVQNVRAAKAPNGDVLASWETFQLDAGAWQVQMRLIPAAFLATKDPMDAGVPDAGAPDAGALDAGVLDAGVPDAGVLDAGVPDAGVSDAGVLDASVPDASVADAGGASDSGVSDAGPPDASAPDAGVTIVFVPVCGCSSSDGLSYALVALLLLMIRGRR